MSAPVNRWFIRCRTCLAVSAVDEQPNTHAWICGICDGSFEVMGRVERDRLITEHTAAICDDRCTSARGPLCSCQCGGKHHGSHRTVTIRTDHGKAPTVTPSVGREQARINADEFRRACAAALALLDPLRASKARGYLPRGEYDRMTALQRALRAAHDARDHRARMRTLRAVLPANALTMPEPPAAPIIPTKAREQLALFG